MLDTTFSRLVGGIYDAVIDPDRWDDTLDEIRRHFGFHIGAIGINMLDGGVSINVTSNVPASYLPLMIEHGGAAMDLWEPDFIRHPPLEVPILHSRHMPPERFVGNAFFENVVRPLGLVDQVVIALEQNSAMVAHFDMGIHGSMPPLTEWHFDGLRLLAPHLRRAAIISGLLEGKTRAAESFEAVLGALRSAVVMVDAGMHIVYANERAEEMFGAGGPLVRLNGRLDLPREVVRGQLQSAVNAAAADNGGLRRGSGIPVRLSGGERMVAHVLPLARRRLHGVAGRRQWAGTPVAAVFVAPANAELNLPVEAIQLLYELTPMETRVLELTVAGRASREVAAALGVAPSTIKTHMLNLYEKTGRHRREELVRLASEVSLP